MLPNLQKPLKGTALLESRQRSADRRAAEQKAMQAALKRDERKCRWPRCEYAAKKLPIDAAHVFVHRGMGGDKSGTRTSRELIAALCRVHHSLLDLGDLRIDALDPNVGTDGLLAFYKRSESGRWEHVATEQRLGVSETRT